MNMNNRTLNLLVKTAITADVQGGIKKLKFTSAVVQLLCPCDRFKC